MKKWDLKREKQMMTQIKKLYKQYASLIKFCMVGAMNTLISLIIYSICLYMGLHYTVASAIGYIGGIANGYILSSKFVFEQKLEGKKGIRFVLIYLSSLFINLIIITILVEILGMNKIVAQVVATGFNVIYNYLFNKLWTFRKS